MNQLVQINPELETQIFTVRNIQVMLDGHLARLYQVDTKVFNQAVKRNLERFPAKFRFQLTESEWQQAYRDWETVSR